jgi:hypothetical protein
MSRLQTCAALAAAILCGACAPAANGKFAADAYYEQRFPVRAEYANAATRQIPPGDWLLLNYQIKNSLPGDAKVGDDIVYRLDSDGDGSLDARDKEKALSLEYRHATTGANLWFRLQPQSMEDARLDLSVVARNHVDASSGSGTFAVNIGLVTVVSVTKQFATRILDGRAATIAGLPAYVVTYEVANVDQLRLSPDSRWRRARVAYIRTPYRWVIRKGKQFVGPWPVLAVVGYDADPQDFDGHLGEYATFVSKLEFMDDARVLSLHSDALLKCAKGPQASVTMRVEGDGSSSGAQVDGVASMCAVKAAQEIHFAPLTEARTASAALPATVARAASSTAPELALPLPAATAAAAQAAAPAVAP